jgi:hypothetical protein
VLGDTIFKECESISTRMWDAIISKTIPMIDITNDKSRIYKEHLTEFCYVSNRDELQEKVLHLKNNENFRKELIAKHQTYLRNSFVSHKHYSDSLVSLLKVNLSDF